MKWRPKTSGHPTYSQFFNLRQYVVCVELWENLNFKAFLHLFRATSTIGCYYFFFFLLSKFYVAAVIHLFMHLFHFHSLWFCIIQLLVIVKSLLIWEWFRAHKCLHQFYFNMPSKKKNLRMTVWGNLWVTSCVMYL